MARATPSADSFLDSAFSGTLPRHDRKCLNLLGIFILLSSVVACGQQSIRPPEHDQLIELEQKNARLEAEVTELQEKILLEQKSVEQRCEKSDSKQPSPAQTQETLAPEASPVPPELEVVRLHPEAAEGEEPVPEEEDFSQVRSSPGEAVTNEVDDDSTRPVLKVRGAHEAWVYHRPVTEKDEPAH